MRAWCCLERALGSRSAAASVSELSGHGNGQGAPAAQEQDDEAYRVRVDSFEIARRGRFAVYTMTVSRGDARWPIRRRYRQVALLHRQLAQMLGVSSMREGLPSLPPRVTCRQILFGQRDQRFLAARAGQLQAYFGALLRHIPYVDQCEALHEFLCSPDVASMGYEALLDLAEAVGDAPTSDPPVTRSEIEALPLRGQGAQPSASAASAASWCPICQEELEADGDIRVLPCGHEYHFGCISQWVQLKNRCCVCQGMAVIPSPSAQSVDK